jgi:hypothetical protein
VLTTCQPSTVWCSRERLPAAAAQPAKVRQSCSATDYIIYYMSSSTIIFHVHLNVFEGNFLSFWSYKTKTKLLMKLVSFLFTVKKIYPKNEPIYRKHKIVYPSQSYKENVCNICRRLQRRSVGKLKTRILNHPREN